MPKKQLKLVIVVSTLCMAIMFLLAACNNSTTSESGTVPSQGKTTVTSGRSVPTTAVTANATVVTGSGSNSNVTPPPGPQVNTMPTPIPGGNSKSQQLILQDRTLLITDVSEQKGSDTTVVSIVLTLTVKNTSNSSIKNLPDFYQLVGSEGDSFGKQSNSSDTFYGPIGANSQRSGMVVFQVPSAAAANLRLMYRPEKPTETVFTPLNLG